MNNQHLQYISNGDVTVGISAKIGGTIFYLSKNKSKNLLKENSDLWDTETRADISIDSDFIPYYGHTIWLGPQSAWWQHQTVNPQRKAEKAMWPPDPFITMGEYEIISQNEWSMKLLSPESPISGVRIDKEIAVNPDGSVFIQVTLINTSNEPKSWDIWFNTRVDGWNKTYVPALPELVKVIPVINENSTEMPFECVDGFFTFNTEKATDNKERSSKAFIYPERPSIYAFSDNHVLTVSFDTHDKQDIHPEQGLVEIYNHTESNPNNSLMELEYHSGFYTLAPYESVQAWEVWSIEDYEGDHSTKSHIHCIKEL